MNDNGVDRAISILATTCHLIRKYDSSFDSKICDNQLEHIRRCQFVSNICSGPV
jgi:hypothetical protein